MIDTTAALATASSRRENNDVRSYLDQLRDNDHETTELAPIYVEPTGRDVLCGRGMDCFRHQGNIHFRELIDTKLYEYTMSSSKKHKMQIIQYVVQTVHQAGGRFLKKENRQWYDGGMSCGKDKVGHSFRDARGYGRKKLSKVLQDVNYKSPRNRETDVIVSLEENRGAAALAAFKLGRTSMTSTKGKKISTDFSQHCDSDIRVQDNNCEGYAELGLPENALTSSGDAVSLRNDGDAAEERKCDIRVSAANKTKEEVEVSWIVHRMRSSGRDSRSLSKDSDDDKTAASSLLFLQHDLGKNLSKNEIAHSAIEGGNNDALHLASPTTMSVRSLRQPCAASVPSESNETNSFYFI